MQKAEAEDWISELVKQEMHRVPKEQYMWMVRWKLRCNKGTFACKWR